MTIYNGSAGNDLINGTSGNDTVIVKNTAPVVATYDGSTASYSNDVYLMLNSNGKPGDDGNPSNDLFLFNDHSTAVGTQVTLGSFAFGTELEFRLHVNTNGQNFFSGSQSRNPDHSQHTLVETSTTGANQLQVNFEDLYNGPFVYNDLSYTLTNVQSNKVAITGDDQLHGLGGKDTVYGYAGNDSIDGGLDNDSINGGEGDDVLRGSVGDDVEKGENGNDVLWGILGNNTLDGGNGDDVLIAGQRHNSLTGGFGHDIFRFVARSNSTIKDFSVADDTIQLANKFFTQLTVGDLTADNFVMAAAALDSNDYVIYNNATGLLSYDADGSGAGAAVKIALLATHPAITHADIVVI